jgi:RNA polymerase sigma-70 factor (ECF subfamily)
MIVAEQQSGDLESIFGACYGRLARVLYRVTGDTGRAEEIASEAFWRLHRKPPRDRTNPEGWLYRTGLRLALDQIKKDRRRAGYEALASVMGGAPSPEQAAARNQERERVRHTLAALKVEQVALILLRAEGFTYAEVAHRLQLNPASVGTLLARAEEAFRKEYVNRYGQP